jgi:hypothetical protein
MCNKRVANTTTMVISLSLSDFIDFNDSFKNYLIMKYKKYGSSAIEFGFIYG